MMVEITNVTDAPTKTPTQVDIYNQSLAPGEMIKIPAELVDEKMRKLEKAGFISIGQSPSWYERFKNKPAKILTSEEVRNKFVTNHKSPKEVGRLEFSDTQIVEDMFTSRKRKNKTEAPE